MASFFYCGRLSSTQLDRWQAPKQRLIIDLHPVEQTAYRRDIKDNGYKSVFTNSWLVRQRNRSWIKGLGQKIHKRVNSFIDCSAFWPGPPNRVPSDSNKHLRVYTSSRTMSRPRVACWHSSRQNSQKTECVLRRLPIGGWKKICGFKRHPMRTG